MSRIAKLFARFVAGQTLTFSEFERLLRAFGYRAARQSGSHKSYVNDAIQDTRVIQPRGKDAKPYQLNQFRNIIEQFALTLDDRDDPTLPH